MKETLHEDNMLPTVAALPWRWCFGTFQTRVHTSPWVESVVYIFVIYHSVTLSLTCGELHYCT